MAKNSKEISRVDQGRLVKSNVLLAVLHGLQAVAVIVLSNSDGWPITTNYLTLDSVATKVSGQPVLASATRTLFSINLAYIVAAFFIMSALAHLVIATVYKKQYLADLAKGVNRARWVEYSASASTMMIGIGLLSGVNDIASLLMLFSLVAIMNLLGLLMELSNIGKLKPNWSSYILGCFAGIIPWVAFAMYVWSASAYGSSGIPTFVYWIYLSIFLFFNCFALNMYLQYKRKGKWANYLYGERVYMLLSLVAKSALAWQVFAGTLRP